MTAPAPSLHELYAARVRAEPGRMWAIYHEFVVAFRASVPRREGRAALLPLSFYAPPEAAPLTATDVARLAKGVAQATARAVAQETVLDAVDALREAARS